MRKLNFKNKAYMTALSIFVCILLIIIGVFIFYRFKALNIKYDISAGSVVYNSDKELVTLTDDTYAKKDLLGRYYVFTGDSKVNIGKNPVIYNTESREIKMLGTFFEIMTNGEVKKLKDETIIGSTAVGRVFKIDDRKYLTIGSSLASEDGSLEAKDYLLVDIDRVGNGYLYNNNVNMKTFSTLNILNKDFIFKVNEEDLILGDEIIDLSKINGSTNEYETTKKPEKVETPDENLGGNEPFYPGGNEGTGGNGAGGNGTDGPTIETVIEEKYVTRKTTILDLETTASDITVNYLVYDPFGEYRSIYVNVYSGTTFIGTYNLEMALTKGTISNLRANSIYRLDFYYTYEDENKNIQNVMFDTLSAQTKNINASITLETTSENSVRYKVIVEGDYVLDSAKVAMYIDGVFVASDIVNSLSAISNGGYTGTINYSGTGEFVVLKLIDCIYNGAAVTIDASYKYKM